MRRYNGRMKSTFILLSLLVAAGMWFWRRSSQQNPGFAQYWRLAGKCLLAGLATYFFLATSALVYLALTST